MPRPEDTAHRLVVQGWAAWPTPAFGSGSIGCDKDGFAFHPQPWQEAHTGGRRPAGALSAGRRSRLENCEAVLGAGVDDLP
jgi:hypothetical protein